MRLNKVPKVMKKGMAQANMLLEISNKSNYCLLLRKCWIFTNERVYSLLRIFMLHCYVLIKFICLLMCKINYYNELLRFTKY